MNEVYLFPANGLRGIKESFTPSTVDSAENENVPSPSSSPIETHIGYLKGILDVKDASDADIPELFEAVSSKISWDAFEQYFELTEHHLRPEILTNTFPRTVTVYKDKPNENEEKVYHSHYETKDNILYMTLRRSPPDSVMNLFRDALPAFNLSKTLFDMMDTMTFGVVQTWEHVEKFLDDASSSSPTENSRSTIQLTADELHTACTIRHTWREETLLSIASRRDPPVSIVTKLLQFAPEANSIRDTPLYNWYPLVYSLAYDTDPEVTAALIPPPDRLKNYLAERDVYDMTPLHWALFYGTPSQSVQKLVDADVSKKSLDVTDGKNRTPIRLALSEGADIQGDTLKAIVPPDKDIYILSREILKGWMKGSLHLGPKTFPNLAQLISTNEDLQVIVRTLSSEQLPTALFLSEFFINIFLIVSFNRLSKTYLHLDTAMETGEKSLWFFILILCDIYLIVREFNQMRSSGLAYLGSIWNWVDITHIVLVAIPTSMMITESTDTSRFPNICIFTIAALWIKMIFFVRGISMPLAVFVSGLLHVVNTLVPFVIASGMVLAGFSQLYMIESIGSGRCEETSVDVSPYCEFGPTLKSVYSMSIDGVPVGDLADTTAMLIISCAFGFIVAVLLLNILIAVVSSSWESVYGAGKQQYWENRLDFLAEVQGLRKLFYRNKLSSGSCFDVGPPSIGKNNFFFMGLEKICIILWPRPDFWGHFPDIVERVCSTKPAYGSFVWQFCYEWENEKVTKKKIIMALKAICLILIFSVSMILLFILGLFTCGYLWPLSVRSAIFGQSVVSEEDREVKMDRRQKKTLNKIALNEKKMEEVIDKLNVLEAKIEKS